MAKHEIHKAGVRKKLEPRREPYWARIERRLHIGFRKLDNGGTWIGRRTGDDYKYSYKSLDYDNAMSYDSAVTATRAWAKTLDDGIDTSAVQTVADACREYVEDRRREKGEANARDAQYRYQRTVYQNSIGKVKLSKLRTSQVKKWRAALTATSASRNRDLATLKAALNYAVASRYVDAGRAIEWKNVKLEPVTQRRDLYLARDQRLELIDALPEHAQPFVRALSLLPLRPGALAHALAKDLKHDSLYIRHDKVGAGRTIALSPAATDLLHNQARDKLPNAPLVSYMDGTHWHTERWGQIIKRVVKREKFPKGTCAYTLRHSVITDMLVGGMDSLTVARMAGTSLAMIEKHYGHLLHKHAADAMAQLGL